MKLDRFITILCHEFELDPELVQPHSILAQDLDFDSFDFLRLMFICEALVTGYLPPADVDLETVRVWEVHGSLFGGS